MIDEITRCIDVTDVGVLLAEDREARAEIAKLKQEVTDLRKIVAELHIEAMSQRALWNSWARMVMPEAEGE